MRKSFLCAALSAFFITGFAHAASTDDVMSSTSITVDGAISGGEGSCAVAMSKNTISLIADKKTMIPQSQMRANTMGDVFSVSMTGDDICNKRIAQGKIAVRFTGPADDVEGTVFANTATGENAAKGVGIGLFYQRQGRVVINQGAIPVTMKPLMMGMQVVSLTGQDVVEGKVQAAVTVEVVRL